MSKILSLDSKTLQDMHRHVQMQNNTEDFLTKLDLIEKYPQLFVRTKNCKAELTKDEIEVLRVMTLEKAGKTFA